MSWNMEKSYANMGQKLKQNLNNQYRNSFESTPNMPNNKSELNKKMEAMFKAQHSTNMSSETGNFNNGNFSNWSNVNNDNVNEEKYELNAPTAAAWNRAHRGNRAHHGNMPYHVPEVTLSRRHVPFTRNARAFPNPIQSRKVSNKAYALYRNKYLGKSGKVPKKHDSRSMEFSKRINEERKKRHTKRNAQRVAQQAANATTKRIKNAQLQKLWNEQQKNLKQRAANAAIQQKPNNWVYV